MNLVSRIESRQRELGLSRTGLSKATGLAYKTILDLSRGMVPTLKTLVKLSDSLGVSLCWFVTGRGPRLAEDFNKMVEEWEASHSDGEKLGQKEKIS